ncbi:MAG: nucleotidyltransferase family protein [Clostridia bacterium]|nr:nucleotidyltransferase family protein [Clostridia bacterium]
MPLSFAALLLAAGASRRMGWPKLLASVGGMSLLRRTAAAACASAASPVLVVLPAGAPWLADLRRELAGLPVEEVLNDRAAEGLSTSLRAGLAAVPPACEAVCVLLADQPLVTATAVDRLAAALAASAAPLAVPVYGDRWGNPVLFRRRLFPELARLEGDGGGRPVVLRHLAEAVRVPFAVPLDLDVDVPADLERLQALLTSGQVGDGPRPGA